ncbi:IclR family transcriptional regulator [Caulobacter rhizosphaerae]|jgi:DNA-binding IclR family transcriptional regulator|uniref:IclR family transcriptional regulator n=1 Tax=Caulobacter rhizosphaerae TaxID=2010972 RepID=UPI0013D5A36F|nr:IclR family transcriptional regulator [Caulobacter rhizosphaerae]GGL10831.1 IclR family transcriptional regulator [Caulobacter rhizosphaerae]
MSSAEIDRDDTDETRSGAQSRTLVRGLEVLHAISCGHGELADLASILGLTRSTTHRLAATLVDHRYLTFTPRRGYTLGPKLIELGYVAGRQMSLTKAAREHLEILASDTGDTVHLGVLDDRKVLYLDKIPGSRRVEVSSRVGERQPLRSTGLGKALLLDAPAARWREIYEAEHREGRRYPVELAEWLRRMDGYSRAGVALDLEENEDRIRCVAAPIRDVSGKIIAAISLSSAGQYMDDERMARLGADVRATAEAISRAFGWRCPTPAPSSGPAFAHSPPE